MAINVTCHSCKEKYTLKDEAAGKTFPCKTCNYSVTVPIAVYKPKDIPDKPVPVKPALQKSVPVKPVNKQADSDPVKLVDKPKAKKGPLSEIALPTVKSKPAPKESPGVSSKPKAAVTATKSKPESKSKPEAKSKPKKFFEDDDEGLDEDDLDFVDDDDLDSKPKKKGKSAPPAKLPGKATVKKPPKPKKPRASSSARSERSERQEFDGGAGKVISGVLSFLLLVGIVGLRMYLKSQRNSSSSSNQSVASSSNNSNGWDWLSGKTTYKQQQLGNTPFTCDIVSGSRLVTEKDGSKTWKYASSSKLCAITYADGPDSKLPFDLGSSKVTNEQREEVYQTFRNLITPQGYSIETTDHTRILGMFTIVFTGTCKQSYKMCPFKAYVVMTPEGTVIVEAIANSGPVAVEHADHIVNSLRSSRALVYTQ